MSDLLKVVVGNGKYTVVQDESGRLSALRYGEPWRDCVGDNLVRSLAFELQDCRQALKTIAEVSVHSEPVGAALAMQEYAQKTLLAQKQA